MLLSLLSIPVFSLTHFTFRTMLIKKINSKYSIILGSNSPRRREILKNLGFNFNVKVSSYDENINFKKYSAAKAVKIIAEKSPLIYYKKLQEIF